MEIELVFNLGSNKIHSSVSNLLVQGKIVSKKCCVSVNSTVKQLSGMGTFISWRKLRKLRLVGLSNVASPRNNLGFRKIEKKRKEKIDKFKLKITSSVLSTQIIIPELNRLFLLTIFLRLLIFLVLFDRHVEESSAPGLPLFTSLG